MATIADGQSVQVPGKTHVMKNNAGVYSCSCTAWRMQSLAINLRTCKHLVDYLGDQQELARVGYGPMPTAWKKTHPQGSVVLPVASPVVVAPPTTPAVKRASTSKAAIAASPAPVLLAEHWDPSIDPTGWLMSEKLDGIRAYWNGSAFISRHGNEFWAPPEFVKDFPDFPLDGELHLGRGMFQRTMSIVRTQSRQTYHLWKDLSYQTFDAPEYVGPFTERIEFCATVCAKTRHAKLVQHEICTGVDHLRAELHRVESLKGEGLMLRKPDSLYIPGKNSTLLKVKNFFDSEAVIVGHTPGKGQHKGKVGAFECEQWFEDVKRVGGKTVTIPKGIKFKVGTGLTHEMRANPPAIGTVITYRFIELTDDSIPRHGAFVAVRDYE